MRFTKKQMDNWKEIFNREGPFQWDIPTGYIVFADAHMSVYRFSYGKWRYKRIELWRFKNVTSINQELSAFGWADAG